MVNKKDLAKKVASKTLLSQKEALQAIDALIDSVIESLEEEDDN